MAPSFQVEGGGCPEPLRQEGVGRRVGGSLLALSPHSRCPRPCPSSGSLAGTPLVASAALGFETVTRGATPPAWLRKLCQCFLWPHAPGPERVGRGIGISWRAGFGGKVAACGKGFSQRRPLCCSSEFGKPAAEAPVLCPFARSPVVPLAGRHCSRDLASPWAGLRSSVGWRPCPPTLLHGPQGWLRPASLLFWARSRRTVPPGLAKCLGFSKRH